MADLPEIDFPWPDCPICGVELQHEDGWWCDACCVSWRSNGTDPKRDQQLLAERRAEIGRGSDDA